jgi:hypothetical protein
MTTCVCSLQGGLRAVGLLMASWGAAACVGEIAASRRLEGTFDPGGSGSAVPVTPPTPGNPSGTSPAAPAAGSAPEPRLDLPADLASAAGLRRLSLREYDTVLADLLGDQQSASALLLPPDAMTPFDNDYATQEASQALVEGVELHVQDLIQRLMKDPVRRDRVVGCVPKAAGDRDCFAQFVRRFGRRALRRPLTDAEVSRFVKLADYSVEAGSFYVGAEAALLAFLQHPEFVYRVEIGTEVPGRPGLFRLSDWELASRLAFFAWGAGPDDWLLDLTQRGGLASAESVRVAFAQMLGKPRARDLVKRFHSMWFNYESLPFEARLAGAMRAETGALLDRVIFEERRPWQDLFRLDETFVNRELAAHYGLPVPGGAVGWVPLRGTLRRGLLGQGTFLSNGAKADDTSPVLRGRIVREALFCQTIPEPPPDVDADNPPEKTDSLRCKVDRYAVHSQGGCASCHKLMDPVGFGLENFDPSGRFREHDKDEPTCKISGVGELAGVGKFRGPAELSELVLSSGQWNACAATQLLRFAIGRGELNETDAMVIDRLVARLGGERADFRFADAVAELAASETFRHRREDAFGR